MTTEVVITGSGTPIVHADNAGPGVMVRHGETILQFDAGRNTLARLFRAGVGAVDLTALFLTHYHSDHMIGLQDIVLSRWIQDMTAASGHLEIVAPNGPTTRYLERMLEPWDDDLEIRMAHAHEALDAEININGFDVPDSPIQVWTNGDVTVSAGQVRHEPVIGAVGYRIETPDGIVAVTGDTMVCDEVAELVQGADLVVYEAMRMDFLKFVPEPLQHIGDYHADTRMIGKQMEELGVPKLMLTHLIPQPTTDEDREKFAIDVREAGYTGELLVCQDLSSMTIGG